MKPEEVGGSAPVGVPDVASAMATMGPFFAVFAVVGLLIFAFFIFCWWRIFSKAGYSGALSLVFLAGIIPLIGPLICLALFIWFAFAQWPALKGAQPAKA
jgi:hypothetical protein